MPKPAPISWAPSQFWDGVDGGWSTFSLRVGTPEQTVRVLPSTAGSATWIVDSGGCVASSAANCSDARGGLFTRNQSTTWSELGLHTLALELNLGRNDTGMSGTDTLSLGLNDASGGPTLDTQILTAIRNNTYFMGMFGLNPEPMNLTDFSNPRESFLTSLKRRDLIPSLSWAYTAGASYASKGVFGSLTFGGSDVSRYTPTNISFALAPDVQRDLVVGIQTISMTFINDTTSTLLPSPTLAFIDSTVPYIYLPEAACKDFERSLGIVWNPESNLYYIDDDLHQDLKNSRPQFTFRLGNDKRSKPTVDIVLPYESFDLTGRPPFLPNVTNYFPLRRGNDSQITLGRAFLQEAYIIVDYEKRNFTVAQALLNDTATPQIIPIPWNATVSELPDAPQSGISRGAKIGLGVGVTLVGLLLLFAVGLLIRKKRKARKAQSVEPSPSEMSEDFLEEKEWLSHNYTHEIGGNVNDTQELHDVSKVELMDQQAPSGSGNIVGELPPYYNSLRQELANHSSAAAKMNHPAVELPTDYAASARDSRQSDHPTVLSPPKSPSPVSSDAPGSKGRTTWSPISSNTRSNRSTTDTASSHGILNSHRRVSKKTQSDVSPTSPTHSSRSHGLFRSKRCESKKSQSDVSPTQTHSSRSSASQQADINKALPRIPPPMAQVERTSRPHIVDISRKPAPDTRSRGSSITTRESYR